MRSKTNATVEITQQLLKLGRMMFYYDLNMYPLLIQIQFCRALTTSGMHQQLFWQCEPCWPPPRLSWRPPETVDGPTAPPWSLGTRRSLLAWYCIKNRHLQAYGRLWRPAIPWHWWKCGQGHFTSEITCLWPPFAASWWPIRSVMGADKVLDSHAAVLLNGGGQAGH